MDAVAEDVSDWYTPLIGFRIIPHCEDHVLHLRTAMGFDNTGTWLLLLAMDGRPSAFSECASLYEYELA